MATTTTTATSDETTTTSNTRSHHNISQDSKKNGVVGPITILTREEAAACLAKLEAWWVEHNNHEPLGEERFKPHLFLPFLNDIVRNDVLIAAVQKILQTDDIRCWSSDLNIKEAKSDGVYCPHQDATYTGLHPPTECVTAWIALSDVVSEQEGCLEFIRGSHMLGQVEHVEADEKNNLAASASTAADQTKTHNLLSRGQYIPNLQETAAMAIPLVGGQATLHHFHTIHQSGPNQSATTRRIGFAIRYMTARVRQTGRIRETITWISGSRGGDDCGFDWEPVLPAVSSESSTTKEERRGREAHADAMQRETANYFQGSTTLSAYDEVLLS
jgi:non-heme Fe2+,alpha-ketoglutarate-dependent halogenase